MRTIFDSADRHALTRRLRSVSSTTPARWGRMSAHQMVCHVADQIRCAVGDIPTRERSTILRNRALRLLLVHLLPWPRGRLPTVPEMQTSQPGSWVSDVGEVEALLERAAARGPSAPWPVHPAFGRMSGREWGWLIYKHTDHHLRQFGA